LRWKKNKKRSKKRKTPQPMRQHQSGQPRKVTTQTGGKDSIKRLPPKIKEENKMNKYLKLKNKHQKEVNDFPMFFAFSDKQFEEGMKRFGLKPTDTDKIYKLGGTGGFYLRTDAKKLHDMLDRHTQAMNEAINTDDDFVYNMFLYELANHEYCITYDLEPTLDACGLTEDEIWKDQRLADLLKKATADYLEGSAEW
jgi:hypothetical protein